MSVEPIKKFDVFFSETEPQKHMHEFEPESRMLLSQLKNIIENAECLISLIKDKEEVEDWVQSKITIADDYLDKLSNYYKH
jgi:hypothetical protein